MPPDINHSGYDHAMERAETGQWAVRLGLRQITGVGAVDQARIEAARAQGRYEEIREAVWRLELHRDVLANLAVVGAFASLGLGRRAALWAVGAVEAQPDLLTEDALVIPPLPPLSEVEEVRLDYALLGCAPGGRHPMRFHREQMAQWGVMRASDLSTVAHGARVRVGGAVVVRQQPGTAKGVLFLTLEDETGTVNVVVMPDLYARARQKLRLASLLAVEGVVERVDGVTHIRAARVRAFAGDKVAEALLSKHFA